MGPGRLRHLGALVPGGGIADFALAYETMCYASGTCPCLAGGRCCDLTLTRFTVWPQLGCYTVSSNIRGFHCQPACSRTLKQDILLGYQAGTKLLGQSCDSRAVHFSQSHWAAKYLAVCNLA